MPLKEYLVKSCMTTLVSAVSAPHVHRHTLESDLDICRRYSFILEQKNLVNSAQPMQGSGTGHHEFGGRNLANHEERLLVK